MSEHNGDATETTNDEPAYRWAVVITGFIGPDYNPVPIQDSEGNPAPLVARLCNDKEHAATMRRRMITQAGRITRLVGSGTGQCIPIYGVMETDVKMGAKRKNAEPAATATQTPATSGSGRGRRK